MKEQSVEVSFIFCCYNQERYIHDAVKGVLSQNYPVAEYIFSDDCSTDGSYEELRRAVFRYAGEKKVTVRRNEKNLGLIFHINLLVSLASGELVVIAAGDDVSFPNRVSSLVASYIQNNKPMLLHSKATNIDAAGIVTGTESPPPEVRRQLGVDKAAVARSIYLGASGAWSRELISKYGDIKYPRAYEDLVMGFRAIIENRIAYVDESLLYYRVSIGISQKVEEGPSAVLQKRKNDVCVMHDTICQRLDDLIVSGKEHSKIMKKMRRKISRLAVKRNFYFNRRALIADLFLRPTAFFSAVSAERKFIRSIK